MLFESNDYHLLRLEYYTLYSYVITCLSRIYSKDQFGEVRYDLKHSSQGIPFRAEKIIHTSEFSSKNATKPVS